jgi:hypothetical protein
MGFMINSNYFVYGIDLLTFVTVKCCVLFEVRTELLNTFLMNCGFKGSKLVRVVQELFAPTDMTGMGTGLFHTGQDRESPRFSY